MKALVIHGPQDLRYETVDDPKISDPRDLIIAVKKCGICGSDLHLLHGTLPAPRAAYGVGHEAVGEVVEAGSAVSELKVGDAVMLAASTGCGQCLPCLTGHIKRCEKSRLQVYGVGGGLEGCQAEAVLVPAGDFNAARIPDGVTEEQAILLTDNLPTAYGACLNANIRPGCTVGVVGLGPIGLMAVELAYVMGASRVYAIDLVAERRQIAEQIGAIALVPDEAIEHVKADTKGKMIDCVVEAVGADATVELALGLVRVSGNISILGVSMDIGFKIPSEVFLNGVTIAADYLTEVARHWPDLIPMIQSGRIKPERFITNRSGLADGVEAYKRFERREQGVLKAVLTP
ncbi:alcohol dehydrogenase catalytic domain-containing protein [Mycobacterium vicinigordonae]|uniref:Alcohol dehydrogenase catalytic domain-containing protein n=1 Tax=Mycobacterium vicinigordonae TaxID=1719132 RepID=A0A7D6HWW3_9MYCO|nr:alcohol dehydrogenase catalytic domain-containing protein [Mycobacterium vicinigordonae]QLL06515.1 alcohol dehydrogenase catalytic domain-containing protein [Mycobacterium vicinigordonae]